jgi:hypothetical protein
MASRPPFVPRFAKAREAWPVSRIECVTPKSVERSGAILMNRGALTTTYSALSGHESSLSGPNGGFAEASAIIGQWLRDRDHLGMPASPDARHLARSSTGWRP